VGFAEEFKATRKNQLDEKEVRTIYVRTR